MLHWHLTPDKFVEEFGYTPEQLQVPVEEQTEDEFGEQTPGVIISVGSLPAAGLARGRLVRVFHSRCSYLDLKSMPESLHCRPNQGLDELVMAMSCYPDRPNASLRLSPAGATASTQGYHASSAIVPLCRDQTFGEIAGVDVGDQFHMLDMGGSPSTIGSSWSAAGGQQVGWSCQGCVEVGSACKRPTIAAIAIALAKPGWHCLLSRGNYRGILRPGMPEITMDFLNTTAPGAPLFFALEPEDSILWGPMEYVWPDCEVT